jgi:hypothetical protein
MTWGSLSPAAVSWGVDIGAVVVVVVVDDDVVAGVVVGMMGLGLEDAATAHH